MSSLAPFAEAYLTIHALLACSCLAMRGSWLVRQPTLRLLTARFIFASCILSPFAVQLTKHTPAWALSSYAAMEEREGFVAPLGTVHPADREKAQNLVEESPTAGLDPLAVGLALVLGFLLSGSIYHSWRVVRDFRRVQGIIGSAYPFKKVGRLTIKISEHCRIPFAVRTLGRAYLILPSSLLGSARDLVMAIAHEGQHHRQGDCWWAYAFEGVRLFFWMNPSLRCWQRVFGELQELACDAVVVGHPRISPRDYGHCLFKVAQAVSTSRRSDPYEFACTVGMTGQDGTNHEPLILRRIVMLSHYEAPSPARRLFASLLAAVAVVAPLCSAYAAKGTLASPAEDVLDPTAFDSRLQAIAQQEALAALTRYRATSAAIAIADPRSGALVAFAEAGAAWERRVFPAASTIKPFVAAAAIDAGVATEHQVYDCRSPYYVEGKAFVNHDVFGDVSLSEAIAHSVNVCLVKTTEDLGSARLRDYLSRFGLDATSQWPTDGHDALHAANAAMGWTVPTTLATLTRSYAILANRGRHLAPQTGAVVSEATAASVTRMMRLAVEHGTATRAAIADISVAAKTGTLEASQGTNTGRLALIAGFAPAENPVFAAVVVVEGGHLPDSGEPGYGGSLAAPVLRNVTLKVLH